MAPQDRLRPGAVRIEPIHEPGLAEVAQLAGVIWRQCYPEIISREQIDYMLERMYSIEGMRRELLHDGIRYDRLMVGDTCAGFASYGPVGSPGVFKLHKIYLLEAMQGRGLGSALLRHCEIEAQKAGAHRLILNVNKRNLAAVRCYERNGFVKMDEVVADIGGGFVMDDYVMGKELKIPTTD